MKARPIIRLLTCGSVDDGKSTLIGRLLVETDSVPHDTLSTTKKVRRPGSIIPAGEIDFSLLTDGLEAEREQALKRYPPAKPRPPYFLCIARVLEHQQ